MQDYSESPASSCLDCNYATDVLFFSFLGTVLLTILLFIIKKLIKNKLAVSVVVTIGFLVMTIMINHSLFVDRVSSWSTFSFNEEIAYVIRESYSYIIIASVLFWISIIKLRIFN
ncbi:hypothetical protein [Chryseobacterium oryctis]|nr:hypothetical protein [Chryseobacterium oryctis]